MADATYWILIEQQYDCNFEWSICLLVKMNQPVEVAIMMTKTKIALAAALLLGVASAAQAADRDDADHAGGFRVGPLGQSFEGVNPVDHPSLARGAYASGRAPAQAHETRTPAAKEPTYMDYQNNYADQN